MPSTRDQRPYNVAYYHGHRDQEIERVRSRQSATLEFLRDLRQRPCMDCGECFSPWVMDFDHRQPNEKAFQLTDGRALLMSRSRLLEEVAKCDIVCANCHAKRTYLWIKAEDVFASWPEGKSPYLARKTAYRKAAADLLVEMRPVPCADCERTFPFYVMQFDHRDPLTKRYLVARMGERHLNDPC